MRNYIAVLSALITVIILFSNTISKAQSVPGPADVNSFSDLNKKRNDLNTIIPTIEKRIETINMKLIDEANIDGDISRILYDNSYFKDQIEKLKAKEVPDSVISSYENSMSYNLERVEQLKKTKEGNKTLVLERDSLVTHVGKKRVELSQLENQINMLMIPKLSQQNFMFWSSIAFVILMCIILGTFFFVVSRDTQIRSAIFGTDSGIQFVTLFCIVIAIILFGLTQVLEGKELSALLGSIAGYILGKVTVSSQKNSGNGNDNQQNVSQPAVP